MTVNRRPLLSAATILLATVTAAGNALAQCRDNWSGNAAVTYTVPSGVASSHLRGAVGLTAGVSFKPESWPVGILAELSHTTFGTPRGLLLTPAGTVAGPLGGAEMWSLTANAVWAAKTHGPAGHYALVGIGAFRHTSDAPREGLLVPWCDPFWGECYPQAFASRTRTSFGFGVGFGVTYWLTCRVQLYLEARYNWVDGPKRTQYVPLSLGVRF